MIIAQISDTHIALDAPDADQRIEDFQAVIDDINALDPAPDLIVHSGDIVHNGLPEEYTKAVEILSEAKSPVYAMVGNKDRRDPMREAFSDYEFLSPNSDFIDYEIDDFPVRLLVLDTLNEASNRGEFCEARFQNLTRVLNTASLKPVAIFMHHPPCEISVGPDPIHFDEPATMLRLRETLHHAGNVESIFTGHVHRSTSGWVENIPVTVMSAVATTLRRGEYPAHMTRCATYTVHRYNEGVGFVSETRICKAPSRLSD